MNRLNNYLPGIKNVINNKSNPSGYKHGVIKMNNEQNVIYEHLLWRNQIKIEKKNSKHRSYCNWLLKKSETKIGNNFGEKNIADKKKFTETVTLFLWDKVNSINGEKILVDNINLS